MTPEQALSVLDQMVARAPGTRADHAVAQQALAVLAKAASGDEPEATPAD